MAEYDQAGKSNFTGVPRARRVTLPNIVPIDRGASPASSIAEANEGPSQSSAWKFGGDQRRARPGTVPSNLHNLNRSISPDNAKYSWQQYGRPKMTWSEIFELFRVHDAITTLLRLVLPILCLFGTFQVLRASGSTLGPFPLLFSIVQSACGIFVAAGFGTYQSLWRYVDTTRAQKYDHSDEDEADEALHDAIYTFSAGTGIKIFSSSSARDNAAITITFWRGVLLTLQISGYCYALSSDDLMPAVISKIAFIGVHLLRLRAALVVLFAMCLFWFCSIILPIPFLGYYPNTLEMTNSSLSACLGMLVSLVAARARHDLRQVKNSRSQLILEWTVSFIGCVFLYLLVEHSRYDYEWTLCTNIGRLLFVGLLTALSMHLLPPPPPDSLPARIGISACERGRDSNDYNRLSRGRSDELHFGQTSLVRSFVLHTLSDLLALFLAPAFLHIGALSGRVLALYGTLLMQASYFAFAYLWTPALKAIHTATVTKLLICDAQLQFNTRAWSMLTAALALAACLSVWGISINLRDFENSGNSIDVVLQPVSAGMTTDLPALIPRATGRYLAPISRSHPGFSSIDKQHHPDEWIKESMHVGAHIRLFSQVDVIPRALALLEIWTPSCAVDKTVATLFFPKFPADSKVRSALLNARTKLAPDRGIVSEVLHSGGVLSWPAMLSALYAKDKEARTSRPWYMLVPGDKALPIPRVLAWALKKHTRNAYKVMYHWTGNETGIHIMSAAFVKRAMEDPICNNLSQPAPTEKSWSSRMRPKRWGGKQPASSKQYAKLVDPDQDLHGQWISRCAMILEAAIPDVPKNAALFSPSLDRGGDTLSENIASNALAEIQSVRPLVLQVPSSGISWIPAMNREPAEGAQKDYRSLQAVQIAGIARLFSSLQQVDGHPTLSWRAHEARQHDWSPEFWTLDIVHGLAARVDVGPPKPLRSSILRQDNVHEMVHAHYSRPHQHSKSNKAVPGISPHMRRHEQNDFNLQLDIASRYWIVNANGEAISYAATNDQNSTFPGWIRMMCSYNKSKHGSIASRLCIK